MPHHRKKKPVLKPRLPERHKLIAACDRTMKALVLARDGAKCVLCGSTQNVTGGHLFSRMAYSTRWNVGNVFAQCRDCNMYHETNPHVFTLWYVKQFGVQSYENLNRSHRTIFKWSRTGLMDLLDNLKKLERMTPRFHYEPTPEIVDLIEARRKKYQPRTAAQIREEER